MNENLFQRYLNQHFPFSRGQGIGDDTSVSVPGEQRQLITKDLMIENIHFRLKDISLRELALKSLAVNLSDIAAMGGKPEYFYLGIGCPEKLTWNDMKTFFQGLKRGCQKWRLELAGGDFSRSEQLFVSITMVGSADNPIYRHNARTADLIGISGPTGRSALGLKVLTKGIPLKPWITRHKRVEPHLAQGRLLSKYVNSMIDVSDGLIMDLKRLLTASGKGGRDAQTASAKGPPPGKRLRQRRGV